MLKDQTEYSAEAAEKADAQARAEQDAALREWDRLMGPKAKRTTGIDEITLHRQVRETGATITVTRVGPGSAYEEDPGWMTECLSHGELTFHETRRLAEFHAVIPSGWCYSCRDIAEGKRPRIVEKVW